MHHPSSCFPQGTDRMSTMNWEPRYKCQNVRFLPAVCDLGWANRILDFRQGADQWAALLKVQRPDFAGINRFGETAKGFQKSLAHCWIGVPYAVLEASVNWDTGAEVSDRNASAILMTTSSMEITAFVRPWEARTYALLLARRRWGGSDFCGDEVN